MYNINVVTGPVEFVLKYHNPRVQVFKILFTGAHPCNFPKYPLVLILRSLQVTKADNHGTSYAYSI